MNINIIREYIRNLSIDDVRKFAMKYDINLSDEEAKNVYNYVKNNYEYFLQGDIVIDKIIDIVIKDAKDLLSCDNYNKVYDMYLKYKDKF